LKKKGIKMSSVVGIDVERRNGESNRDRDRRVLTAIMQESLGESEHLHSEKLAHPPLDRLDDTTSKTMRWKKWLKTAMESQLRIVNWPPHVEAPGPSFDFKRIGAGLLADIVKEYIDFKQSGEGGPALVPNIVRWTDGKYDILQLVYNIHATVRGEGVHGQCNQG
jgi:hypothetical protein